jgi:hypothetical protein
MSFCLALFCLSLFVGLLVQSAPEKPPEDG